MDWNRKYYLTATALAALWIATFAGIEPVSMWITAHMFQLSGDSHFGAALQFFIYDTAKILLLLAALIYAIAFLRASLNIDRVRDYLAGKGRGAGYFLASVFGAVTPFCSCSSIPLFLGFTSARIPFGITMAFLITSPLINEIAVVLLWGLLGWKFTIIYAAVGLGAGILGGLFMDSINAGRWLQPWILDQAQHIPQGPGLMGRRPKLTVQMRHKFAYGEMKSIFQKVWIWVIAGVGIGALMHGYVPADWFATHLGAGQWWTVPAAVFAGIPLYTNVTGIVPIMESLLLKGLPAGTTLAFCMSAVAASIPEMMLLRKVMTAKLQIIFLGYLWVIFTLAGWIFNALGTAIL